MASTVITTSANPIERHRMVRIGGDRICEIALTAASNMAVLPLVKKPSREVDTPKGFGKGFDKSLPASGKQDRRQKQEVAMTRVQELYPDSKIVLREVGLRDGLQLVKTFPSTEAKQRWMRDEYAAGVRHFEVGSFLPAKTFPQFADVRDIIQTVASLPGAYGIALALNERGVNEALASGVAEVATVVSATEEHSQANANRSRESAIANVRRLCELRDASAHKPVVNAAISMALGCSIVGAVSPAEVLRLTEKLFEAGVDMVAIADTVGYAGPKQVGELVAAAVKIAGSKPICIHLHDTRGMGIANASAALDAGARVLDGSLGGLGGCPFAPGATGNVVFEDLVFLCESKGFATGIDIEKLIAVRGILKSEMPGEALYGGLARAGLPRGAAGKAA
jgi:hydroxymethylglutaryl-CoA lyase